jgi:hypothetical protein
VRTRLLARARAVGAGGWLWVGTLLTGPLAGVTGRTAVSPVLRFLAALVAIAFAATVMTRTVDRHGQRLRASAVGVFQAVTGNLHQTCNEPGHQTAYQLDLKPEREPAHEPAHQTDHEPASKPCHNPGGNPTPEPATSGWGA